ncbi:zinc ABC transporter substrate-binding protein [Leucobacter sp. CSA2]|uniref:Zinc ABC transporter substrate-binding protein n=1 Tax=Leucobacter edaphi TaxID=2796472 RepID=A0A934UXS6_9MICO|nr:zinc ABC transporter substrate-binding protein [Leucobacter edaphi]MBK0421941.1 zinc ABC transporter substrate-binding protein [Leucobacter edaphi]
MHPNSRKTTPLRLAGAVGALAATLLLASCSGGPAGASDGPEGKLKVVATTTQLQDFAAEVGGDDIELTGLLQPGASAHHFDPSPADLLALSKADVLVVNGANLEAFVDSAVQASGFSGKIVTAADGVDLEAAKEITKESGAAGGDGHDHSHAGEGAGGDAHAHAEGETHAEGDAHAHAEGETHAHAEGETHAHGAEESHSHEGEGGAEAGHSHDHGDLNPHIWTSPKLAEGMVNEVAYGFEQADPKHKAEYQERAKAYTERLHALDEWTAAQFARVPAAERVLVSGHNSMTYYLHDYGIEFAGSILPSFEDNAEPSAADVDALVAKIKEKHVKAVFVESSMSPKLAQTIAKEAGVKVVDAETLYADSLGKPGTESGTYIGATISNTQTILDAWGAKTDKVPDTIN